MEGLRCPRIGDASRFLQDLGERPGMFELEFGRFITSSSSLGFFIGWYDTRLRNRDPPT